MDLRGVGWASHRNLSFTRVDELRDQYEDDGLLPINIGASRHDDDMEYSLVWRENVDGREWAMQWDLTSTEYHDYWEQYRDDGMRPLDVEAYDTPDGVRYAGIWIENREGLGWASRRNMTASEFSYFHIDYTDQGLHPIDIETRQTPSGRRISAIWYEEVGEMGWELHRSMTRTQYQDRIEDLGDRGLLVIDYESYDTPSGHRYDVIAETPADRPAYQLRTNRDELDFANLWRQYNDEGYRPLDLENHGSNDDDRFGAVWIQNSSRFEYDRKGQLDTSIQNYLTANSLPGISVAVFRNQSLIYRRGFGDADAEIGKDAWGGTVYLAASASKVFGGTLAAKLEEELELADGTPLIQIPAGQDFSMGNATSTYVTGTPAAHSHTLNMLMAHTGCVMHYPDGTTTPPTPGISDGVFSVTNYATAQAAATTLYSQSASLMPSCTIGTTFDYSTHAFTLLGAALEAVTGRDVHTLVNTEYTQQFGLSSVRSMFGAGDPPPDNYERAIPYITQGNPTSSGYSDNSWKVFGGGLEMNVVDLARFGNGVLNATIVSANVRDNRLWNRTFANSPHGVAWRQSTGGLGRATWEHGGSWTGARSHLEVYPNDNLVIAIMSNMTNHSPSDLPALAVTLGSDVLSP